MARVDQSKVTWVAKGTVVNGKKTTKGYLALKTDKAKPFSGTVTGVKSGTTMNNAGMAKYAGGRNVAATAARTQTTSGSSAAAGTSVRNASGSVASRTPAGAMTQREKDARSATKPKTMMDKNPYMGGRAAGIAKKKDGTYSTASGDAKGATARGTLEAKKALDKKNDTRNAIVVGGLITGLAAAPLAPAAAGAVGTGLRAGGAAVGRTAAGKIATQAGKKVVSKAEVKGMQASKAAGKAADKAKTAVKDAKVKIDMKTKGQTTQGIKPKTGSVRKPGDQRPLNPAKPTPAQKSQATKANNKLKNASGKKK